MKRGIRIKLGRQVRLTEFWCVASVDEGHRNEPTGGTGKSVAELGTHVLYSTVDGISGPCSFSCDSVSDTTDIWNAAQR